MNSIDIHNFNQEIDCVYKDERYSVRDNGAILRHPRNDKHLRPIDNQWTFGKPNDKTGYMTIASVVVHRIVATAFHGIPPTTEHIVDHIDTNRRNNRPENLRWVTRLENALSNPITLKRIKYICGSIESFLDDPSKLAQSSQKTSFKWMRNVTPEEARNCYNRMQNWAKSNKTSSDGALGEWIFEQPTQNNLPIETPQEEQEEECLIMSKTHGATQKDWQTPSEFPCCPQESTDTPIASYVEKLKIGAIFAINDIYKSIVLKFAADATMQTIYVMCESDNMKPWSLAKITYENGMYIHANLGSFFSQEGAEKYFCLEQGLEWTGGDTFDDYC